MMSNDVGAMLVVSTDIGDGMHEALDTLQAAAKAFAEGAGNSKSQWEKQNKDVTEAGLKIFCMCGFSAGEWSRMSVSIEVCFRA